MRTGPRRGMLVNTLLEIIIGQHLDGISLLRTTDKVEMTKMRNHYARVLLPLLDKDGMLLPDVVGKDIVTVLKECVRNKKTVDSKAAKVHLVSPKSKEKYRAECQENSKRWMEANSKVPRFNFCDMSSEFCDMSLQFSATCPQNFARVCDTSLSFAIFTTGRKIAKTRHQILQPVKMSLPFSATCATCLRFLRYVAIIHLPNPQPPIQSSSGCHVCDEVAKAVASSVGVYCLPTTV